MGYVFDHQVRFHETDGAGVVYFANGLVMCHAAYEASLAAAGLDVGLFFEAATVAYPIVHASMDYRRPLRCGDRVAIHLTPSQVDESTFEIQYQVKLGAAVAARGLTRHTCIEVASRQRRSLPPDIAHWIARWGHGSAQPGEG